MGLPIEVSLTVTSMPADAEPNVSPTGLIEQFREKNALARETYDADAGVVPPIGAEAV